MKKILMLCVSGLLAVTAYSQTIVLKGKVNDKADKSAIAGATVALIPVKDTASVSLRVSDSKGNFQFSNLQPAVYLVRISFTGYEKIEQKINLQASNKDPIPFTLNKMATDLAGVVIVATAPPVKQKGDTTEFSANQFKVNPDATAEDMIKKLPGITVGKDGTVTAMGEQVKKVTVDGRDFFGDDATAALRNLPADVIDKIQVFDRLSDQAQLTGFDDGNSIKTVNIVTKNGIRNGQFGRIYAGAGTDSRYSAGGNVSFFKGDRRLSLVGNFNNINQQNFASQDLLGVTSGGGGFGGRGGGGRGGGGFGGSDNFNVGQQSGISKTNAAGINFSNVYNKKLTLTGSYFFNNSSNTNESLVNDATVIDASNTLNSIQHTTTTATNYNHRLNMRLEYKIDSANSLFVIPSISYQKNNSVSNAASQSFYNLNDSTNTSNSYNTADKHGYNIRNSIMFRHAFPKRGRTLAISFNTTWTQNDGTGISDAAYRFFKNGLGSDSLANRYSDNTTNGSTIGGNIAYTEPIGKKAQLQIDYTPSVQKNKADQQTFEYDGQKYSLFDTAQSNKFDNTITTNNVGLNYRLGRSRDEQFSVGINFQASTLESQRTFPTATSVHQTFSNVLPNLMYRKKLSNYSNIRVFYRASTNFPSINQLQDVVNISNPLSVSSGNPDLKQSYTHFLAGRYSYTNSRTSKSFFANIMLQAASDYITNGIYIPRADSTIQQNIVLKKNSQFTKPVNLDGYKSLRTFFTYSMPLKFIKTTMNLNAGFTYSRAPGLVNYVTTATNAYTYNTGIVFASNISEFVDFNLSYSANFNNSTTQSTTSSSNKYVNQVAGAQVNLLTKKGWFLQNDISGNNYTGLSAGLNQSFWLWNVALGKKVLKKQAGEIKLSVFDLLKQNQSISRTITGPVTEDVQTQVLRQYFMLTFTYKLKNFGTPATNQNNFNRGGGPRPGGFGGGMGGGGF
ncbi:MAG: TonB-dependent receptor [Bacteroidetes bacterium]|nr:TonB-dependent receptor [Bacteroidota bacterium]